MKHAQSLGMCEGTTILVTIIRAYESAVEDDKPTGIIGVPVGACETIRNRNQLKAWLWGGLLALEARWRGQNVLKRVLPPEGSKGGVLNCGVIVSVKSLVGCLGFFVCRGAIAS